jgi:uroporphyrinogen-III synthase
MSPLFLLTRVDPADDALAIEAAAMGYVVIRESLLATEPGADARWLEEHLDEVPEGTGLAWTSRRAAEALVQALPLLRRPLARVPMYAVGEESAVSLRRAGFSPHVPAEPGGAAELARFIATRAGADRLKRVIFLHGNRALPDLPEGLRARGIDVEFLEVYRTRFQPADLGGLEVALREGTPVIAAFFSPSGVDAFERLLSAESRERFRERGAAIARGLTTAGSLHERGYRNVLGYESTAPFSRYAQKALQTISGGRP